MQLHQREIVAAVAVAAGLFVAAAAGAQTTPQPPAAATWGARLDLTEAQREEIRALGETHRKDARALAEKMRAARRQLREAMRADVPDEAAVRSAAGAVATLQAERAALRARAKGRFMSLLTPEQREKVNQARAQAARRAMRAERGRRQAAWRWWE